MLVLGQLLHVVQPDQDHVHVVLLEPADRAGNRALEAVDRNLREGVVGADLPEDQLGLIERNLDPQALAGRVSQLTGKTAIDDLDVETLRALENAPSG